MKKIIFIICLSFFGTIAFAQSNKHKATAKPVMFGPAVVEASCGECKFGMHGTGCALAVKIKDKAYLVEGKDLNAFGDAHGAHGMCNEIRKAEVEGEIKGGKFIAKNFKLLPVEKAD